MFLATIIIVAHAIVPHQHQVKLEIVLHECFFSDSDEDSSDNIFIKLGDAIKHVNLGEKHLENFRISSFEYDFSPVSVFEIPSILTLLKKQIVSTQEIRHIFCYVIQYTSTENDLSSGLRAPPTV